MKILIINGPNLNLSGKRSSNFYGHKTLAGINSKIKKKFSRINFEFFQSNIEGEIITKLQGANTMYDGLIINPGGYAHTSVAIRDALEILKMPKIEVHLSNLAAREKFRNIMITASVCDGYVSGFKEYSYIAAIEILIHKKFNRG